MARTERKELWAENDRIRREGTRHLVNVSLALDVRTFVYPSVTLPYVDRGDEWIDTDTAVEPSRILLSTLEAEAEVNRFTEAGRRGIVLRMAQFYGPEAFHTLEALQMARSGLAALFGSSDGYQASIWVDDAARAVVAAMQSAPAGIYNIADDEPLRRTELLAAMAAAVGRKRLVRLPAMMLRFVAGPEVTSVFARSQRVSNRDFKKATGWSPTMPSAREGWRALTAASPDHVTARVPS